MFDRLEVARIARSLWHIAAGEWIEANPTVYVEGVMRGFVATDPWDAPPIGEDNNLHHDDYTENKKRES